MKTFFCLLFGMSLLAQASEYPSDYSANSSCQTQDPVTVCRAVQIGPKLAVLDIYYSGRLRNSSKISAWIKINYADGNRQATFQMTPYNPENQQFHFRVTGGCLVGTLGGCEQRGTEQMRDLLAWAQQYNGKLNALDLNLAFFNDNGIWDNNNNPGGNYHFYFPEN